MKSCGPWYKSLALVVVIMALAGCATSREIELQFRVRELEQIVVWKDEDNAELMRVIDQYERGLNIQARIIYELDRNCNL